jgi:hypothetical protein
VVETAERADAADEEAWRMGSAGQVDAAVDALGALAAAADDEREALAGLLRRTAGGGLSDRPRVALTDALTGALVALTDWPGLRSAAQLRPCRLPAPPGPLRPRPHRPSGPGCAAGDRRLPACR